MSSFDRPQYEDVQRTPLLELVPKDAKTVLDVGCNSGGFGKALKEKKNLEFWGVGRICKFMGNATVFVRYALLKNVSP